MKRYDFSSLRERIIARLRINQKWRILLDDSTLTSLIDALAETFSETARYAEYLLMEKKWKTAGNMSSLVHMGGLISAKRQRPTSASGFVIVSHTDENDVNRLQNLGKSFFSIDDASDYDDLVKDEEAGFSAKRSLVPWTFGEPYVVPRFTRFFTSNGLTFFSIEPVRSRVLREPYSVIRSDNNKYEEFLRGGGWNGIKYVRVPIIQGTLRDIEIGRCTGTRFETFLIPITNVEAAANAISQNFFVIRVQLKTGKFEIWTEIHNIRLAGPYDKVFQADILEDGTGIKLKFGDGITGQMLPGDNLLHCQYIETAGLEGNVEYKYQINKITFPEDQLMIDPRNNEPKDFLNATNIVPIMGGRDEEKEEDFKTHAPKGYLKSYATATQAVYETFIMEQSPVSLLSCKVFPITEFKQDIVINPENRDLEVWQEIALQSNYLGVTAVASNGEKIFDPENSFLIPITKAMGKRKGPNDFLKYVDPVFIKIAPSVAFTSRDRNVTQHQAEEDVSLNIFNLYSVYSTDFGVPYYASDIMHAITQFPYCEYANTWIEALADVSYDQNSLFTIQLKPLTRTTYTVDDNTAVCIPFTFNKLFVSEQLNLGFKNYKHSSPYVIKVDITFKGSATTKNRTLFMYDNRQIDEDKKAITLEDAKHSMIDPNGFKPVVTAILHDDMLGEYYVFDETQNGYDNRQCRVAQYEFVRAITDKEYMATIKSYVKNPFEHRPYVVDQNGENKIFETALLTDILAAPLSPDGMLGDLCFKHNLNYHDGLDIIFYETDDILDPPHGYVMLTYKYLGFLANLQMIDPDLLLEATQSMLENQVKVKVYAIPLLTEFNPLEQNDIIFTDLDDIKVELR